MLINYLVKFLNNSGVFVSFCVLINNILKLQNHIHILLFLYFFLLFFLCFSLYILFDIFLSVLYFSLYILFDIYLFSLYYILYIVCFFVIFLLFFLHNISYDILQYFFLDTDYLKLNQVFQTLSALLL